MPNTDAGGFCCDECFVPSHDDYRGNATPDYCGDLECECHDKFVNQIISRDEKPSFRPTTQECLAVAWFIFAALVLIGVTR